MMATADSGLLDDDRFIADLRALLEKYEAVFSPQTLRFSLNTVKDECVDLSGRLFGPTSFSLLILTDLSDTSETATPHMASFLEDCIQVAESRGGVGLLYRLIYVSSTRDDGGVPIGSLDGSDGLLVPMAADGEYSADYADNVCRLAAHIFLSYGRRTMRVQTITADLLNGRFQDALAGMESQAGIRFVADAAAGGSSYEDAGEAMDEAMGGIPGGIPDDLPPIPVAGLDSLGMMDDEDDEMIPRRIRQAAQKGEQDRGQEGDGPEIAEEGAEGSDSRVEQDEEQSDSTPAYPLNESARRLPYRETSLFYLDTLDKVRSHLDVLFGIQPPEDDLIVPGPAEAYGGLASNLEELVYEMDHNWDDGSYVFDQLASIIGFRMAGNILADQENGEEALRQALDVCDQMVKEEGVMILPSFLTEVAQRLVPATARYRSDDNARIMGSAFADVAGLILHWIPNPQDAMDWALLLLDGEIDAFQRTVSRRSSDAGSGDSGQRDHKGGERP